jgi:hypothetical protein
MGFLGSIAEGFVSAVGKVAEVATGGVIGKYISDALGALGLPPEICGIMAMIGDPSYSMKFITEEIDRVGKALGLPESVTGALKKIAQKADEYAKAFAQGGFGAVIAKAGEDLGLPPALYEAVAAAVDAYTGNAAGAAAHLVKCAAACAEFLGVPGGALHAVAFVADAYTGNTQGMIDNGLKLAVDVVDNLDVDQSIKDAAHLGVSVYTGADTDVIVADSLKLAGTVAEDLGLPPEVNGALKLGAGYLTDNDELMKEGGKEILNGLIDRTDLPPIVKEGLKAAGDYVIDDPAKAKEKLKNLGEEIKKLPAEAREKAEQFLAFIDATASEKLGEATDVNWKELGGKLYQTAKDQLPEDAKFALEVGAHIVAGDKEALTKDLAEMEKRGANPKAIETVKKILAGDVEGLKQDAINTAREQGTKVRDEVLVPLRG